MSEEVQRAAPVGHGAFIKDVKLLAIDTVLNVIENAAISAPMKAMKGNVEGQYQRSSTPHLTNANRFHAITSSHSLLGHIGFCSFAPGIHITEHTRLLNV